MMVLGDIPVQTTEELVVGNVSRIAVVGTWVVAVGADKILTGTLQVSELCTLDVLLVVRRTIFRSTPTIYFLWSL